jgi:spore germination protein GerM
MKKIYAITLLVLMLIGAQQTGDAASMKARSVKVYLVAVGDEGKMGRKIGCGDSLVPVTRSIKATSAPLRAALQELLSLPREYSGDSRLSNFWVGNNLRLKSVSLRRGTATIHIIGEGPFVAGICDEPRITSQIEATARQFPTVRRVRVFVNGRTLRDAIS